MPGGSWWGVKRFVWKVRVQYFSISTCLPSTSPSFKTEWWKSTRCSRSVHGLHLMNLIHTFIVLAPQSPLLYFPLQLSLQQSSHWVCNLWDTQTAVKLGAHYGAWFVPHFTHMRHTVFFSWILVWQKLHVICKPHISTSIRLSSHVTLTQMKTVFYI